MTTILTAIRARELGNWDGTIGIEGEDGEHEIVVRIPFDDDDDCHEIYESVRCLEDNILITATVV